MNHPFGDLLRQLRARKAGLSQTRLAELAGYDRAIVARMSQGGKDLTGPSGRERVVRISRVLHDEGALSLLDEANALLAAARMPPLYVDQPAEAELIQLLYVSQKPKTAEGQSAQLCQNLPVPLTRFIGRERELAEIVSGVGDKRLVTITGAAGMGKTRLSIEVGSKLLTQFADGVWFIELAPIADGELIPAAIAAVFGLSERPSQHPIDQLVTFLQHKQILLILDNCEHLVESCAQLAEVLLHACAPLHILATSRESLRIMGEAIWRVLPLRIPEPGHALTIEQLMEYDAVKLFVEQATLVDAHFTLAADHAAQVALICQCLDGMPLAIEMAAAQIADLGIEGVVAGLNDRFGLLIYGSRTALPRHQTLRATLDWSYELLSDPERLLLARLSVFAGSWTAVAARVVCADGESQNLQADRRLFTTLPILQQLVRKSLVMISQSDGQTRYHLLATVKNYANDKLKGYEHDEESAIRDRHLAYYLAIVEETTDFGGRHVDEWISKIELELDNLRAAFAWANLQEDCGEAALRLSSSLGLYWVFRGHINEGLTWLNQAFSHGECASTHIQARALRAKGGFFIMQGNATAGVSTLETSLALYRDTEDRVGMAWCLEMLANNRLNMNQDTECAHSLAKEALTLFRESGSKDGEARILRALGASAYREARYTQAMHLLEQALKIAQEIEDLWEISTCLDRIYDVNPKRALELSMQEVARWRVIDNHSQVAAALQAYGNLLVAEGAYAQAVPILEESVEGQRSRPAFFCSSVFFYTLTALGYAESALSHIDQAVIWLRQARQLSQQAGEIIVSDVAQLMIASLLIIEGKTSLAKRDTLECLHSFHKNGYRTGVVCALVQLANIAHRIGNMRHASILLGTAKQFAYEVDAINAWESRIIWRWHYDAQRTIAEPTISTARVQLGEADFQAAYTVGQHRTLDQAVKYALTDE